MRRAGKLILLLTVMLSFLSVAYMAPSSAVAIDPIIEISSPLNNSEVNDSYFTFSFNVTETKPNATKFCFYTLNKSSTVVENVSLSNSSFTWNGNMSNYSTTFENLTDGNYTILINCTDQGGNSSEVIHKFNVSDVVKPNRISLSTSTSTDSAKVRFTTDEYANYTLKYWNSSNSVTLNGTSFSKNFTVNLTNLMRDTDYWYNLTLTDINGNSNLSTNVSFSTKVKIHRVRPTTNTINSTYYPSSNRINVTFLAKNASGGNITLGQLKNTSYCYLNGTKKNITGTGNRTLHSCFFNTNGVNEGLHTLSIHLKTTEDHTGNLNKSIYVPRSIYVDAENESATTDSWFDIDVDVGYASGAHNVYGNATLSINSALNCESTVTVDGETSFDFECNGSSSTGTYTGTVNVTGIWGLSGINGTTVTITASSSDEDEDDSGTDTGDSTSSGMEGEIGETSVETSTSVDGSISLNISNSGNSSGTITDIKANQTGDYTHFNITYPSSVTVGAGGSEKVNITFKPYKNAKPGDYTVNINISSLNISQQVTVTVSEEETPSGEITTRKYLEVMKNGSKTVYTIRVRNEKSVEANITLKETIPKSVANSTDDIDFETSPTVIEEDPVVEWIVRLGAGKKKDLVYTVSGDHRKGNFTDVDMNFKAAKDDGQTIDDGPVEDGDEDSSNTGGDGGDFTKYMFILIVAGVMIGSILYILFFWEKEKKTPLEGKKEKRVENESVKKFKDNFFD